MSRRDFEFRKELLDRDFFSCLGGTVDSVEHLLNSESRFAGRALRRAFRACVNPVLKFCLEHVDPVGIADECRSHVDHEIILVSVDLGIFPVASALGSHCGPVEDVVLRNVATKEDSIWRIAPLSKRICPIARSSTV